MKKIILATLILFAFTKATLAADEPVYHLKTLQAEIAKAAVLSYNEGHYRYLQGGQLIEAFNVDESKASCIVETGHMLFNPDTSYVLESARSLDVDAESGEIELNFKPESENVDAYFQIYCFQSAPAATLDTAREGLKNIFEIQ